MSSDNIGTVGWFDLTVPNAEEVRDFYSKVTGWVPEGLNMGEYEDFVMKTPTSQIPVAGVCHKRGTNNQLPPYWIIYITVADLEKSLKTVTENGGRIIIGPKNAGESGRYCIISDPAGAYCGLFQYTTTE